MENKIKVGKVIPFNSSYKYSLYACFDEKGKFKYYIYDNKLICYIDDLLDIQLTLIGCDIDYLRKLEDISKS